MIFLKSPLVRMSFGLVLVTISLLLISDMLGFMPDTRKAEIKARKAIAESLAIQFSVHVTENRIDSIQNTLQLMMERNHEIKSAAIRKGSGAIIAEYGGHQAFWELLPGEPSTPTQIQVPLISKYGQWGTVELAFKKLGSNEVGFSLENSLVAVVVLVALCGFLGYWLFLKRALRELDPSAVIPERVRMALDTLSEGLVIVDADNTIIFSNSAFAKRANLSPNALVGRAVQSLDWQVDRAVWGEGELPWNDVLRGYDMPTSDIVTINLVSSLEKSYKFVVNASPIISGDEVRGAMITFDDVTEVESKNVELQSALQKLEKGQLEIARQNQELHALATRDPLTNLLNRRSFMQAFDSLIHDSIQKGMALSVLVVDIDHFKSVNDVFGHAAGDSVIKLVASLLQGSSRSEDVVGRFGGEEFCILLPEIDSSIAMGIAERIRIAVESSEIPELEGKRHITVSIGITDFSHGATDVAEAFEQADKALYMAKESGRNRVIRWPMDLDPENEALLRKEALKKVMESVEHKPASENNSIEGRPNLTLVENKTIVEFLSDNAAATQGVGVNSSDEDFTQQSFSEAQASKAVILQQGEGSEALNPAEKVLYESPAVNEYNHGLDSEHMNINRSLLIDRVDQAVLRSSRNDTTVAILAMEFDITQHVDDELSTSYGDALEQAITERLREGLRKTDTILVSEEQIRDEDFMMSLLRTGMREVIVLLTDMKDADIVSLLVRRLVAVTKSPISLESIDFFMDVDVGISLFPHDSNDGSTLLNNARSALREAKKAAGSNNWQFYSHDINVASKRQRVMESEMHLALERGEFQIHYQPKICLKQGAILGAEALLRWKNRELGMVSPDEFIPLAEQSELIDKITMRLVSSVCDQIASWHTAGFKDVQVGINLSPVQFRNEIMAENIIEMVQASKVSPADLELEITENVVMHNMEMAIKCLTNLRNHGFSIAVDDFGVGYSTFSYLKNFPIDCIKIDKSFVADLTTGPAATAIISGIIAMAQSLNLNIVAEGVETEDEMRFLQDLGCDKVQGYLISRPVPADEFTRLLEDPQKIRRIVTKPRLVAGLARDSYAGVFGIINQYEDGNKKKHPRLFIADAKKDS